MKLDLKDKNSYSKLVKISIPWDELQPEYDKEFNKFKSNYAMPGFRKGKVPNHIIKKNLMPSINSKFIDHAINIYYKRALDELKLTPINQGNIVKLSDFQELKELSFEVEFEIVPIFNLPNYKKQIKINTQKFIANDYDIKEALHNLQMQHSKAKSIEGKLKSGNFIYADFTKLNKSGEKEEDHVLKNHYVKIGEGLFTGDLEKKFLGKEIGDSFNITINQESGLINYNVLINKIEEQILPKANDEFAKLIDVNISGIKELKDNILKNIQNKLSNENLKEFNQKIIDYFIDKTKMEAPLSMVENYKKHLLTQYEEEYKKQGRKFDENKLNADTQIASQKMIKWHLIKDKIIVSEDIKLDKNDVDNHIKDIMKKNPLQQKEIKKYYKDSKNKNQLYQDLLDQKLFNTLHKNFINTIKEKSTDQIRKQKVQK